MKLYFADKVSFADVVAFNLGEVGMTEDEEQSLNKLISEHLYDKVDIEPGKIHTLNRLAANENTHSQCKSFEREIIEAGGLDLVLCDLNPDGSLAFNEPGSARNSACRLMLLGNDSRTRTADLFQSDMEALDPAVGSGDVTGLEIANKSFHMMSKVYVGNTLEEALKNAGLSDEVIASTVASVERYNELCKKGDDVDYCKSAKYLLPIEQGPFYVSMQTTAGLYNCGLNTITGLVVNGNMQVLNADRSQVIPGLYAVGNCMGQRFGNAYSCPSAGNNMGNALTTGRVAGKHAAAL